MLINYLKSSVDRIEKDQDDPDLNKATEKEQEEWLTGVRKGVEEGWLRPDSLSAEQRIGSLTVVYADYFYLSAKDRGGYSIFGKEYVVLGRKVDEIEHIAKHEFNHALIGSFDETWINEAITEHIAQVIDGRRDVEYLGSFSDYWSDSTYRGPRDVLEALVNLGPDLKVADFTRAYSRGDARTFDKLTITRKVASALGMKDYDPLQLLNVHIEKLYNHEVKNNKSHMVALRLACARACIDVYEQPWAVFGNEAWETREKTEVIFSQVAS